MMDADDEFSRRNTMNIPHHLAHYGYISLHSSDIDRLLKIIDEVYGIKARVERDEPCNEPGKRKYLIVNPDVWEEKL